MNLFVVASDHEEEEIVAQQPEPPTTEPTKEATQGLSFIHIQS